MSPDAATPLDLTFALPALYRAEASAPHARASREQLLRRMPNTPLFRLERDELARALAGHWTPGGLVGGGALAGHQASAGGAAPEIRQPPAQEQAATPAPGDRAGEQEEPGASKPATMAPPPPRKPAPAPVPVEALLTARPAEELAQAIDQATNNNDPLVPLDREG